MPCTRLKNHNRIKVCYVKATGHAINVPCDALFLWGEQFDKVHAMRFALCVKKIFGPNQPKFDSFAKFFQQHL